AKVWKATYRPFTEKYVYFDRDLNSQSFRLHDMYDVAGEDGRGNANTNPTIAFLCKASSNPLAVLATNGLFDTCLLKKGNGSTQGVTRWRLTKERKRIDNITDWATDKFRSFYEDKAITKDAIFAYVYAVLHDPIYRELYALNLRREFPRIPFYADFKKWREWGSRLLALHTEYETAEPFPLMRTDTRAASEIGTPRVILKADRQKGIVVLDTVTQLSGIPPAAWQYSLANRSAIDWVLDQHKERKPEDLNVRGKFNSYRFSDHKKLLIPLLKRVVRVSLDTVEITEAMRALGR
ncbi:MAG: type ISP restriction/modification enzyme, partial [Ktedonobacteraceae bacterium]